MIKHCSCSHKRLVASAGQFEALTFSEYTTAKVQKMQKTKIISIALIVGVLGIATAFFASAQGLFVVSVEADNSELSVDDADAHGGSFISFAALQARDPQPDPDPGSQTAFDQRCGPQNRLTEGNIVNVSTQAQAQAAINDAQPGDVIRLAAGVYSGGLRFDNVNGTADAPITFEAAEGAYRDVIIENAANMGIRVTESSHLSIRNVQIRNVRFGIFAFGLENSSIENNHIHDTIWKGIQVSQTASDRTVSGRPSSNVEVVCNLVHDTGRTDSRDSAHNGEGIYIGSGFVHNDRTDNITVAYNEVHSTTGEGIELKHLVRDSSVLYNKVHDITLHDSGNAGAIAAQHSRVGVGGHKEAPGNPNILIKGNRVWNVARSSQQILGGGGTGPWPWSAANAVRTGGAITVTENIFWNTQDAAVKIQDLDGDTSVFNEAVISNNIIHNASFNPQDNTGAIRDQSGVINLTVEGNITERPDSFFVGPVVDDADEGRGLIPAQNPPAYLDDGFFW